jgi:sRNA-binding regulator protein Hfq
LEELQRLGMRLEMEQSQLEERVGKPLAELTRTEAKDWIKRFRDMLEEISPSGRVSFGQWPGSHEDREATYLTQQRDAGTILEFKLFNGERFRGKLSDFTAYTVTLQTESGEEVVLRKLAIVYYRQASASTDGVTPSSSEVPAGIEPADETAPAPPKARKSAKAAKAAAPEETHQPLATGLDSDRAGDPDTPEKDNMDEDRGL